LVAAHLGDALQCRHALGLELLKLVLLPVERALALVQALLALFQLLQPVVKLLSPLLQALVLTVEVRPAARHLLVELGTLGGDLIPRLAGVRLCLMPCPDDDILGFLLFGHALRMLSAVEPDVGSASAHAETHNQCGNSRNPFNTHSSSLPTVMVS